MKTLNRFFKYAKGLIFNPGQDIDKKIIDKIESLSDKDNEVLDEGFMEFLKKSNSRPYLFNKKLKENSGYLIAFSVIGFAASVFLLVEYRNYRKQKNSI